MEGSLFDDESCEGVRPVSEWRGVRLQNDSVEVMGVAREGTRVYPPLGPIIIWGGGSVAMGTKCVLVGGVAGLLFAALSIPFDCCCCCCCWRVEEDEEEEEEEEEEGRGGSSLSGDGVELPAADGGGTGNVVEEMAVSIILGLQCVRVT